MTEPRIYFGPAYGRAIEPDHMKSVYRLLGRTEPHIKYRPECNDALIDRSRSRAATRMLRTDCDVHLSIDSDIVFDADAALEICRQALEYDLVAGIYVTRSKERCFPTSLLYEGQTMDFGGASRVEEIRYAATGFLAVHRRVYEALIERLDMPLCLEGSDLEMYPFYTPFVHRMPNGTLNYLSEDFALCERARQAGFRVYANPAVRLVHLGQYPFRLEDLASPALPTQAVRITRNANGTYSIEVPTTEHSTNGTTVQAQAGGLALSPH